MRVVLRAPAAWRRWFAWRPVIATRRERFGYEYEVWVWLEWVEWRCSSLPCGTYDYREVGSDE